MASRESRQAAITKASETVRSDRTGFVSRRRQRHVPTKHEVETFTGLYVDTERPQASTIDLHDIAHALAQTCRYGGHTSTFYSVAEHAVLVSRRLEALGQPKHVCLAGLHHDDAEAYLGDIPRPLKIHLGARYRVLSDRMDEAIVQALLFQHLPGPRASDFHAPEVKEADNWALFIEARHLLPSRGINWSGSAEDWDLGTAASTSKRTPPYWTAGLSPSDAEGLFLTRHYELT